MNPVRSTGQGGRLVLSDRPLFVSALSRAAAKAGRLEGRIRHPEANEESSV